MLWYGFLTNVPSGWHICDGKMNTPDLRNVFVVGAGGSYDPNDTGGVVTHSHPYVGPLHTHTFDSGPTVLSGINFAGTTEQSRMSGDTDSESHLPPFKSLVFIMKIN